MKKILIISLILVTAVFISGCTQPEKGDIGDKFVASWEEVGNESSITFFKNGNYESDSSDNFLYGGGTYSIENSSAIMIMVTVNDVSVDLYFDYEFSSDYSRLTLTDSYGKSKIFVKL